MYDVMGWRCMVWWTGGVWCGGVVVFCVAVNGVIKWLCLMWWSGYVFCGGVVVYGVVE